jgi:hypothetical protein
MTIHEDTLPTIVALALGITATLLISRAISIAEQGSCTVEASSPADRYHVRLDRPTPCDVRALLLEAREAVQAALAEEEAVNSER